MPPATPPPFPPFPLVQRINKRYNEFVPGSSALDKIGVIIHSIDGYEDPDEPWQAATSGSMYNAGLGDRISCSIVWKGQQWTFMDNDSGLYYGHGSLIMNPYKSRVLCAYGGDGATRGKTCSPPGASKKCLPACIMNYNGHDSDNEYDGFCHSRGPTDHFCDGRPWRPSDLGEMLSRDRLATQQGVHSTQHGHTYNELVLDGLWNNRNLPGSIEAFLASPGDDIELVKRTHGAFLERFRKTAQDVPLLIYRRGEGFGCLVC